MGRIWFLFSDVVPDCKIRVYFPAVSALDLQISSIYLGSPESLFVC